MTTMPIDNHPLTQRRLQFTGINVNKLTLKSNNYNIVSSFICWNQNIVHFSRIHLYFLQFSDVVDWGFTCLSDRVRHGDLLCLTVICMQTEEILEISKWHFVTTSLGHIFRPKSLSQTQYLVSYENKTASGAL